MIAVTSRSNPLTVSEKLRASSPVLRLSEKDERDGDVISDEYTDTGSTVIGTG